MQLFQGEKPAHDFLSLHTGGGSSSPVQHSTQAAGYELGVHNSLKPLKLGKRRSRDGAIGVEPSSGLEADSEEHVLPGGVGTFSIRQVASATQSSHGVVRGAFPPAVHGSRTEGPPHGAESGARAHSGPATMWQDSGMDQRSRGARGGEGRSRSSGSSADQGPSTPRSKHSATEQRRRTKINDRLEVLRELLPHGDQKKDKASFLLEVIEYVRFLQEKVQKYESAHPQKNHDSTMPWAKVYYRSCWKNTENINQGGGPAVSTQDANKEQYGSKQTTVPSSALFDTQSARETSANDISSQKATSTAQSRAEDNIPSKQTPWLRMSTSDSNNRTLSKNEKQTLHDDSQSLSDAYSQGLLNRLTQALKRSGVDPSQASISVEISMDRRTTEPNNIHDNLKDNECEDTIHVAKKLRCERS